MKITNFFTLTVMVSIHSSNFVMLETECGICSSHCTDSYHSSFLTTIEALVSEKLNSELKEWRSELNQIEDNLINLPGKCPVRYNSSCFYGIFSGAGNTTYQYAADKCKNDGGELAGVYSNDHLNQLIMYALPQAAADATNHNISIWTGMTYKNGQVILRDGSSVSTLEWSPSYPQGTGDKIIIIVDVDRGNEGIGNVADTTIVDGVFCEIDT